MSFVELEITKSLPDTVAIGTEYTIEGTAKIEGAVGAPPWVYAELQHKEWNKPSIIESVEFARGLPIPITGEFKIKWTPEVEGIFDYTVIATPAPLLISGTKSLADILSFPVLARSKPALKTTTGEGASSITDKEIVSYDGVPAGQVITKNPGDTMEITVRFMYQGPGSWRETLYAVLSHGTDEVSFSGNSKAIEVTESSPDTPIEQEFTIDIPIPNRSDGPFDIYVKLGSKVFPLVENVVEIQTDESVISDLNIVSYDSAAAGQEITKSPGDTMTINVQYKYKGPGNWTKTLYANLAKDSNEVSGTGVHASISVENASLYTPTTQLASITLTIPNRSDGPFDILVKIGDWVNLLGMPSPLLTARQNDVVNIRSEADTVSNLAVFSYDGVPAGQVINKSPGDTLSITVSFQYQGLGGWQKTLYANLAKGSNEVSGTGVHVDVAVNYSSPNQPLTVYATILLTIPNRSDGPFDILVKIGDWVNDLIGMPSPLLTARQNNVVQIQSAGAATLTVTPTTVQRGNTLSFNFTGFRANSTVTVRVAETGKGSTVTADSSGAGYGAIVIDDPAGSYILEARDTYNNSASANFTVTEPSTLSTLTVTPSTINSGDAVTVSFTGFKPGAAVTVQGAGSSPFNITAGPDGNGSQNIFIFSNNAGTFTMQATDNYGHSATTSLTIMLIPAVTVSPTSLKAGETLTFTFTNFVKNGVVTVKVLSEGGSIVSNPMTANTDANGGGTGYIGVNAVAGLYFLFVTDTAGNEATASFRITGDVTGITRLEIAITGTSLNPFYMRVGDWVMALSKIYYSDGRIEIVNSSFVQFYTLDPHLVTFTTMASGCQVKAIAAGGATIYSIGTFPGYMGPHGEPTITSGPVNIVIS
jgi:hypothetical protein